MHMVKDVGVCGGGDGGGADAAGGDAAAFQSMFRLKSKLYRAGL